MYSIPLYSNASKQAVRVIVDFRAENESGPAIRGLNLGWTISVILVEHRP